MSLQLEAALWRKKKTKLFRLLMQMETHASNCGSFRQPYVPINKKKEGPVYSTFTWSTFLKSVWNVCYCGKLLRQQKKKYWFVFFRNMKKNPKIRKQLLHKFMMKLQSILLLNFVILECKLSLKVPVSYHVRIQPCGVILVSQLTLAFWLLIDKTLLVQVISGR